jgi:multimeric flavodoxin WrbA
MTREIPVISASPGKNANSDILCDEFMRGSLEAGHQVSSTLAPVAAPASATGVRACRTTT